MLLPKRSPIRVATRLCSLTLALAPSTGCDRGGSGSEPTTSVAPATSATSPGSSSVEPTGSPVGSAAPSVPPDPRWPTGRESAPARPRPPADQTPIVACSWRHPICVHAATAIAPSALASTLEAAEHAADVYVALGVPRPYPDGDRGGGPEYDLYLVRGAAPLTTVDPVPTGGSFDSASAFTVLPPPPPRGAGCVFASDVARASAQAALLRIDAGIETGTLAMVSSYFASLAAPCTAAELAGIDEIQRAPEREVTAGRPEAFDGNVLLPAYLEERFGGGRLVRTILGLVTVAVQKTPPGSWQWKNEPDVFDALRQVTRDRSEELGSLLLDLAVARAFLGDRSDGGHLADTERFGALGRIRFEWSVPFASLPRRLAPLRPVSATGATYLWIDLAGARPGSGITFVADWELPVTFHWVLVKVDREGRDAGHVDVAAIYGSTHAERTVVKLDGLAGLVVVGVNGGDLDRATPFDPDEGPFEPHGYTVTLHGDSPAP